MVGSPLVLSSAVVTSLGKVDIWESLALNPPKKMHLIKN